MITLFLAMKNEIFVRAFSEYLAKEVGAQVIGYCKPGPGTELQVLDLQPDIILMDVKKESPVYLETIKSILARNPLAKIIGISTSFQEDLKSTLRLAGARGYLIRSVDLVGIKRILQEVSTAQSDFAVAI
jgi:DNA-binding NarL/FixJ family response regulator